MRGGRVLFVVALLGLVLLTPLAGGAASTGRTVALTVSVVDTGGDGVANAKLTATWENGSTTETTASNGKAFIDVPAGADVTIEITHPNYVRNFPYVVENASERDVRIEVARKGQATVTVTTPNESPVEGARVTVSRNGRTVTSGKTGTNGAFETGVIEQGTYRVHVVKPGYVSNTSKITVGDATKATLQISQESVLLTLAVRDDHYSPPRLVENVTISVGDVATVRAANGKAAVSVPVNTRYTISVRKPGYTPSDYQVSIGESPKNVTLTLNRAPSLSVEPMNERVVVGETVRVTVTDEYGAPVPNATVLVNDKAYAETDSDGAASVPIKQAGVNTIVAKKSGLTSATVNVTGVAVGTPTATPTATAATTATETTETSSRWGPGFGVLTALVAIVAGVLVRLR